MTTIKTTNIPDINRAKEREKFPKALVDAFLNLDKTSVKIKECGVKHMAWTNKAYKEYRIEAEKYLGSKAKDAIESSKLVVLLARATMDLRDVKKKKEKQTKKD